MKGVNISKLPPNGAINYINAAVSDYEHIVEGDMSKMWPSNSKQTNSGVLAAMLNETGTPEKEEEKKEPVITYPPDSALQYAWNQITEEDHVQPITSL